MNDWRFLSVRTGRKRKSEEDGADVYEAEVQDEDLAE